LTALASGGPCGRLVAPPRREINNNEETAQPRARTRRLGVDPASAGAPGHDQHATHRSSARPQWTVTSDSVPGTDEAALVPARPRPARALNPATGASGLPRNHLLAPTAGVGSCRPPTARQNANSCKDGVRHVGNFLHGKYCPLVLCACGRTRRGERGVTTTAGSHARPPLWDPTGGVVAERCSGGADGSRVARILVLYSPIACAAHPDIRGHAPPPRGRVAAIRRATRPAAGRGRSNRTTPHPQADRAGDPMRASIRGSDIQCQ